MNVLISQFNGLGDAVLITGCLRELKRFYHVIVAAFDITAPIFKNCPYVDELYTLSKEEFTIGDYYIDLDSSFAQERINDLLSQIHADLAINLQWNEDFPLANIINSHFKDSYGFECNSSYLINHVFQCPHIPLMIDKHYYLLSQIIDIHDKSLTLPSVKKQDHIVVNIGGSQQNKRYSIKKLAKALNQINEHFIIVCGKKEEKDAIKLCSLVKNCSYQSTSIEESIQIVGSSKMYIGNDSFLLHVASAYNIPIIGLYRESIEKTNYTSFYTMFSPYQYDNLTQDFINNNYIKSTKPFIGLRPEHSLLPCRNSNEECLASYAHCINQINPETIVKAYNYIKVVLNWN